MTITKLEATVLNAIARDFYQPVNGAYPHDFRDTGAVWTFSVSDTLRGQGIASRAFSGLASTLKQKGLIDTYRGTDRQQDPDTIELTATGYTEWLRLFPAAEAK